MTETALEKQSEQQPAAVNAPATENIYVPDVDIYEDGETIRLVADLPGVDKDSVDVTVEKNVLTIQGLAVVDTPDGCRLVGQEYGVGRFRRDFTLSSQVDSERITAKVAHGVLELTLPKRETAKTRKVEIGG